MSAFSATRDESLDPLQQAQTLYGRYASVGVISGANWGGIYSVQRVSGLRPDPPNLATRGNLRGTSEEPLKESISWQVQGMAREVQISWGGGGLGQPPPCSKNKEFVLTVDWVSWSNLNIKKTGNSSAHGSVGFKTQQFFLRYWALQLRWSRRGVRMLKLLRMFWMLRHHQAFCVSGASRHTLCLRFLNTLRGSTPSAPCDPSVPFPPPVPIRSCAPSAIPSIRTVLD